RQQNKRIRNKNPFSVDRMEYDAEANQYLCPIGEPMSHIGWTITETKAGYPQVIDKFRAKDCKTCLLNGICNTQKGDRVIEVSLNNVRLRKAAEKRLKSSRGVQKRKQR